ncbi:MAG TPA: GNAT family N-acetyltransferase [Verrucomicrobiae bacterium]|nr:GNAT family N-acetyltransferase [Verrucomicrobiae bacterium]
MDFTISPVTPADVPEVLEQIRELARFEKLEHEVQSTVELLNQAFFGEGAAAGALIARQGAVAAGYAIYFFTFSTFVGRRGIWLEDVYVRPQYRRHGLGRTLIEQVARIGVSRGCGRFEWVALNWNKTALDFYEKLGAVRLDDWVILRLDSKGLRQVADGLPPTR